MTTGNVAALAGMGDDRRKFQTSVPIQFGNSGGPVLDMAGNIVGVAASKLDVDKVALRIGDRPEPVSFAISAGATRAFLDSEGVPYATAPSDRLRASEDVAAAAVPFTVSIECWVNGGGLPPFNHFSPFRRDS